MCFRCALFFFGSQIFFPLQFLLACHAIVRKKFDEPIIKSLHLSVNEMNRTKKNRTKYVWKFGCPFLNSFEKKMWTELDNVNIDFFLFRAHWLSTKIKIDLKRNSDNFFVFNWKQRVGSKRSAWCQWRKNEWVLIFILFLNILWKTCFDFGIKWWDEGGGGGGCNSDGIRLIPNLF